MTTSSPLRGLWLPIVTPFRDGAVDLASYERLYQNELARLREIAQIESHIPMKVIRDYTSPESVHPRSAHV